MNEPKRRGRPPKAKPCEECGQVGSHYDDCSVGMGVVPDWAITAEQFNAKVNLEAAQAYALRVWNGQSPNVPRNERIRRVMAALNGQNLPTEGVELP